MLRKIETGTPEAEYLGFREDLFSGWIEFDSSINLIVVHFIISRRKNEGNCKRLFESWIKKGFDIWVVMPRPIMQHILNQYGFVKCYDTFPDRFC